MYQLDTSVPALQEKIWRYLQQQLALAARRLVEALMEYERDCFLGCDAHQRTPCTQRLPQRLSTQAPVKPLRSFEAAQTARARLRGSPFRTQVFELYQRRQPEVDQSVLQWVAGGLSTRRASLR